MGGNSKKSKNGLRILLFSVHFVDSLKGGETDNVSPPFFDFPRNSLAHLDDNLAPCMTGFTELLGISDSFFGERKGFKRSGLQSSFL